MSNLIISSTKTEENFPKATYLLKILTDYGCLIKHSLNLNLTDNSKNKPKKTTSEETHVDEDTHVDENESDTKIIIKSLEYSIESKMLSIDLLTLIINYFIQGIII